MSRTGATLLGRARAQASRDAAYEAAARAEGDAGVRIRALTDLAELSTAAEIWRDIWGRDGVPPVSAEMLRAMLHSGNYVAAAYDGVSMLAALFGFYGGADGPDHLHSHILGVQERARFRGVGYALKLHQRLWALERDVDRITWTYDPLVRANAFFNLVKLGAAGVEYLVDFYGDMPDAINGGDQSDRILVSWDLIAAAPRPVEDLRAWAENGAALAVELDGSAGPIRHRSADAEVVLCATPPDIVGLRRSAPAVAARWRVAVRETMLEAWQRGLRPTGMTRGGYYVLTRPGSDQA